MHKLRNLTDLNYHAPAANTAAVVTLQATTGSAVIKRLEWSYDGDPAAAAEITIAVDGSTVWSVYITTAGPGFNEFPDAGVPLNAASSGIVVTLPAGGVGVTGRLNVMTRRT